MYITSPKRKNGSTVVRLVESFWKEGKVKNRIVKTIGQSKDPDTIEKYKETARTLLDKHKKGILSLSKLSETLSVDLLRFLGEDRYNNGFEDILGAGYEKLGFSDLIKTGKNNKALNKVLRSLVLMRVFSPASKLKSCHLLERHFNKFISHKQVLGMMDHLSRRLEQIRREAFHSLLKEEESLEMLLFDVTTLSFESVNSDDLRDFGYSKDGKFNEVQVVLAVLANQEGLPVAYEIFPGNTGEVKTLKSVLSPFIRKHKIKKIRVTADRAMFSKDNFAFFEDLEKEEGIRAEYVVSCPLKKLPDSLKERIFDFKRKIIEEEEKEKKEKKKKGKQRSFDWCELSHNDRKIVVSYSKKSRLRDEKKRQRLLDKLDDLLRKEGGKIPASKMVKNTGYRRYLKTLKGSVEIDKEKIIKDSRWDGLYGVCYEVENKKPEEILKMYRSLWRIEELFRINKHTLKMRPIYHRLSRRIRAHILICFLAYTVLRWTEIQLAKKGLNFSPQKLIDILKDVESFIIRDQIKRPTVSYCVPRALSEEAKRIYRVFNKEYAKRPYQLR